MEAYTIDTCDMPLLVYQTFPSDGAFWFSQFGLQTDYLCWLLKKFYLIDVKDVYRALISTDNCWLCGMSDFIVESCFFQTF